MGRRKKSERASVDALVLPGEDYWSAFLKAMGLTPSVNLIIARGKSELSEEVRAALSDPLFASYLKYGPGKTGGPSTVAEFMQLSPEQQRWYLNLFRTWKKIVKRDGIDKTLLKMGS